MRLSTSSSLVGNNIREKAGLVLVSSSCSTLFVSCVCEVIPANFFPMFAKKSFTLLMLSLGLCDDISSGDLSFLFSDPVIFFIESHNFLLLLPAALISSFS